MTHRWIDPLTGAEQRSDTSPGPNWLAVITLQMPDGTPVSSTPTDISSYLNTIDTGADSVALDRNIVVVLDFPDRPAYDAFRTGSVALAIVSCPYFDIGITEEDDDGVVAEIVFVPNATSLPPEDVSDFDDPNRDTTLIRPGGGGGQPRPMPVIPWNDKLPLPGDPDMPAPEPSDDPLEPTDDLPDGDVDLESAARQQADKDVDQPGGDEKGDQPGGKEDDSGEHVPGGDTPCPDCNGTGQEQGDGDGDGDGDDGDSDDGEEDLLKELLGDSDGDSEGDGDGDSEGDGDDGDSDGDDSSGGGDNGSDECKSCGGTGQQQSDDGDGDDDGDGEDDLSALIDAANSAIDAANAAIDGYRSGMDAPDVEALIESAVAAAGTCHELAEPRSVVQRSILRRAVDAAKRALDLDELMERDRQ